MRTADETFKEPARHRHGRRSSIEFCPVPCRWPCYSRCEVLEGPEPDDATRMPRPATGDGGEHERAIMHTHDPDRRRRPQSVARTHELPRIPQGHSTTAVALSGRLAPDLVSLHSVPRLTTQMTTSIGPGEGSVKPLQKRIVVMNLSLILHPLDYSAGVKTALARALALATWHDADLHVLHVRSRRRAIAGEEAAHARVREFVEARNPEGIKFETVRLVGDPGAAVADYARHQSADLLVVDKHGRRVSKRWRAGVFAKELANRIGRRASW